MEHSPKKVIESSLENRKSQVEKAMSESKSFSLEELDKLENLDDTNEKFLKEKLRNQRTDELKIKSFDTVSKDELIKYGIKKNISNREAYFYFLHYISLVMILNNEEINIENNNIEEKINPELLIDFSEGKMSFLRTSSPKKITENISYAKFFEKRNIDMKNFFPIGEKITLKNLRAKLSLFQEILTYADIHRKNFPDFESELYFHYQLINVVQSFLDLENDYIFLKKKNLIRSLNDLIENLENHQIKDVTVLNYIYMAIDLENELESNFSDKLEFYTEVPFKNKDGKYIPDTNQVIIRKKDNSEIIINNADLYELGDKQIHYIVNKKNLNLPLGKSFYSLKGDILLRDFTMNDGNIIYEKFLPSNLLKDIINKLYGIEDEIFGLKNVINTFEKNTFYFPIQNPSYSSYTDKECFKIFIDYKIKMDKDLHCLNPSIKKFIKKAIMINNMEHEFGHAHKAFLYYFDTKIEEFDSPITKIILNSGDSVEIKEGGLMFEYIMYGREITELNLKEVIYINNLDNFSKNLKSFRNDFINLEKKSLKDTFEREGKNNKEIRDIYEIFKTLSKKVQNELETKKFKLGKINKYMSIDLENMLFYTEGNKNHNSKHRKGYIPNKFSGK